MRFNNRVLELCKKIPKGKVTTYGEIANALKTSPRAVGQALKRNKTPIVIPCHRVVKSDGSLGGYHGITRIQKKAELLKKEGILIKDNKIRYFDKVLFKLK